MSKKYYVFTAIAMVAVALYNVVNLETPKDVDADLTLKNVESLASSEGTNVSYCFIEVENGDTYGWQVFCDEKTDANKIYPCPSEKYDCYNLMAKDRCTR